MAPIDPTLEKLMTNLVASNDALTVAYGHNYLFEERVPPNRHAGYEELLALPAASLKTWRNRHKHYLSERVYVRSGQPETFSTMNAGALLRELAEEQWLVRLENLGAALALQGRAGGLAELSEQLEASRSQTDKEATQIARQFLEKFCEDWSSVVRRDHRPSFAAFFDEVRGDIEASDWPHRVRNRLGLSHYNPTPAGRGIPVALLRYRVAEVLGRRRAPDERAFAVPTALDCELNSHFFPSPREASYGRTLDLEPDDDCERLVAEVLHRRIEYRPEHLFKVGWVTTAIPPHDQGSAFARLRNGHLFCLRLETGRDEFGADIPEIGHG